ncbi:coronatine-insensitive protein homolog 1b isoform X2 [Phragmites australis]|uniref:coronatine-insensitive protein homolog 1b isoform X2 n=1 Tax=Phragmites australis TaxID=29695 RepID=UPI002D76DD67|nr:coronatine-insensitive protein homolog 1b isoform X2 [Phragmites australis]
MGGEAPEPQRLSRAMSFCGGIPEEALHLVMGFVDDPRDREAASLVCRRWHHIDALTRKHVTVPFCYAVSPARLLTRFPRLESLAVKGKPRASMYGLIPDDWGAYARPWVAELAAPLECLKAFHLRRMVVTDDDLVELVRARGHMLQELKLDKCTGFSTDGLRLVARSCRSLRILFLEECQIDDKGSEWIHDLAASNSVLVTLNFHMTDLRVSPADLELLAENCKSLFSLKISDCDLSDLIGFFRVATALEEFAGGTLYEQGELTKYGNVKFPSRLCSLGLTFMGTNDMPVIFPFSVVLKKLDLQYTILTTEDHCQLIAKCPNLLVLAVRNVIGDRGLGVVADTCKKLQRLRIERGDDDPGLQEEQGGVSQVGLTAIAVGCRELEYIAAYVSDITNGALESIGTFCKKLYDFRLVLLDREERITELPLDNGVRALLRGCTKLRRFALYLRPGGLSDAGLGYVGQYSGNIQYMLLGNVGETDDGLIRFALGSVNLRKLELRSCCFSERALALAILHMPSLRYVWVQGYKASQTGRDLMFMARPFWNIEFTPPSPENADRSTEDGEPCVESQAQILAYYSLAGKRLDCPQYVVPLYPA